MTQPLIVVGAGLAGWTTVRELRKLDHTTPVIVVTADSGDFYAKPSLSNAFVQGKTPAQLVTTPAAKMVETLGVTLMARTRVDAIDTVAGHISTSQGRLGYSQLVLATGAQPIRVPLKGDAADAVLSVNSLDDFALFHGALAPGAHVVIMGAGLIGCEFANDLAAAGYQVSVVDPGPRPLSALLPQDVGEALRVALRELGVIWHFNTTVRAVHRSGASLQAELANGEVLLADVVLSAVGLRADTSLALAAGIDCERGILVDSGLRTSAAQVHALGDGAQYASAGRRTLPYVMPIMNAARVLAARLAGKEATLAFPLMPVAIKTPALPLVVALPEPGVEGHWQRTDEGVWHFLDEARSVRGFVLVGKQTSRRAEVARMMTPQ